MFHIFINNLYFTKIVSGGQQQRLNIQLNNQSPWIQGSIDSIDYNEILDNKGLR